MSLYDVASLSSVPSLSTAVLSAVIIIIVLMVQAQDYINVPPRERKPHWEHYEIPESQIQFQ
jgi:hypothetical protein